MTTIRLKVIGSILDPRIVNPCVSCVSSAMQTDPYSKTMYICIDESDVGLFQAAIEAGIVERVVS